MLTGIVAKDAFAKAVFELRAEEPAVLNDVLPWLHAHNPWFSAYSASCRDLQARLEEVREEFAKRGHALPGGLANLRTSRGTSILEELGDESIALLLPLDEMKAATGTHRHLRAAAEVICTSELCQTECLMNFSIW